MRIGVDARELTGRPTGVGRYLAGLLAEWSTADSARRHDFVLYSAQPLAVELDTRKFVPRVVDGAGGTWWEQMTLPPAAHADHLDVWFAPGYTSPLRLRIPTVVTVHDISFVVHPEWFTMREGARRRWVCRHSAETARAIVAVSTFTKNEMVEWLNLPAGKIHVIPSRIVPASKRSAATRERPNEPRVLYVGSIFNRRRVVDLIRAFAPIARTHSNASLDIVGDDRTFPRENLRGAIAAEGVGAQVRWHKYVDDARLQVLYANARAFAFLSEYEGFGLTPLEALAAGVPALLADTPVAHESCGDAALYVPVGDLRAATQALERLLFDDSIRARLLQAAPAVLRRFDASRAAAATLAVIEAAADT
ncbi:MAG TPA: glycosyltransferase family 1 protein [Vicinamibacterales bacterium]|nr:glycosyltransferase family 1 protein [Vicinamibacterales bacterium]